MSLSRRLLQRSDHRTCSVQLWRQSNVLSNVGNGYDNATGIFTVPHNGTYTFALVTMTQNGGHYAWIILNGERLSVTHGTDSYKTGKTFNHRYIGSVSICDHNKVSIFTGCKRNCEKVMCVCLFTRRVVSRGWVLTPPPR